MKTVKRINGNYEISTINNSDNITISTSTLTVNGNLVVTGTRNEIKSIVTTITDQFITLADGNNNTQNAGIEVVKNVETGEKAGIRYNIETGTWQTSTDNVTWFDIMLGTFGPLGPLGSNTQVLFNDNGLVSSDAEFTYNKTSNTLTLNGSQVFTNQEYTPSAITSSVVLYSKVASFDGSGLYFVNSSTSGELVSKNKAIFYSIIF